MDLIAKANLSATDKSNFYKNTIFYLRIWAWREAMA